MKNPKIIHVISNFPTKSETFIINVIIESINKGFNSYIVSQKILDLKNSSQLELLTKYNLYNTAKQIVLKFPNNKFLRILKAIFLALKHPFKLPVFFRTLNQKKYGNKAKSLKFWYEVAHFLQYNSSTVFHAHFGENGILLAQLKEIGAIKGKILTSFYGYDTFSTQENRKRLQKKYELLVSLSDEIIVNSNYLKRNLILLNIPSKKIKVVHVGVDIDLFKYKIRKPLPLLNIITVGRLIKLKGQHLGIKVIKILKEKGLKIHYTIIGDGEEMLNLQHMVKELSLQKEISLVGAKTQKEIINQFEKSDIFLMTSITDAIGRAEGQGLVTAEAQATGLPIIAFDSGGVGEVIIDNKTGYTVKEKDTFAMVDKIEKLIKNKTLRKEMSAQARDYVKEHLNNIKQAQKIIDLYV